MKKLSLIIAMFISAGLIINIYAADTLSGGELSGGELIGGEFGDNDLKALEELDLGAETWAAQIAGNTTENEKIVLSTTWEKIANSVTLTFKKIGAYSNYKIYYSKTSDSNLLEQEITSEPDKDNVDVTINNLEPNMEYQFIGKAFNKDGEPIAATESDPLLYTNTISEPVNQVHNAYVDNVIHEPVIKVEGSKITISYKPWVDVSQVQISMSDDWQIFKPITSIEASQTSYTFTPELSWDVNNTTWTWSVNQPTWKKYIKIVPISKDGTVWICKVGETIIPDNIIAVESKKDMWKPKTWPEMYLLVILAIFTYIVYALRKRV